MSDYNGWTNKATWLVNVWYNPESVGDVEWAGEDLIRQLDELDGCAHDMLNAMLHEVNWQELKATLKK